MRVFEAASPSVQKAPSVSTSAHNPNHVEAVFDEPSLVSDSGLLLMATLAGRLGLPGLVGRWV